MVISLAAAWRVAFVMAFFAAIFVSACARAPRQALPGAELRRLVLSALALYAVGGAATITHHRLLAGLVYGAGIMVCALAAWLSRGRDPEDPPDDEPVDEQPPPEPDGEGFDWAAFERDFRAYQRSSGRRSAAKV